MRAPSSSSSELTPSQFTASSAPRIDILTEISGIEFDEAWGSRTVQEADGLASGRTKDLADIELLQKRES
jgi:hypothetical protein